MLSIIIPVLNEEKYLSLLLNSIRQQKFGEDYEIIVADAGSKDRTAEMARSFGCQVVPGGLPAKGRNEGAKAARGELLLFLDADTILPAGFLADFLSWFSRKKLDVAACSISSKTDKFCKIVYGFASFGSKLTEKFLPHAFVGVSLVKRKYHEKVEGFDESIKLAEDIDYVRRGARVGNFAFFYNNSVLASNRRFKVDGYISTSLKYFLAEIYMSCFGPIRTDIFNYRFSHYSKKEK